MTAWLLRLLSEVDRIRVYTDVSETPIADLLRLIGGYTLRTLLKDGTIAAGPDDKLDHHQGKVIHFQNPCLARVLTTSQALEKSKLAAFKKNLEATAIGDDPKRLAATVQKFFDAGRPRQDQPWVNQDLTMLFSQLPSSVPLESVVPQGRCLYVHSELLRIDAPKHELLKSLLDRISNFVFQFHPRAHQFDFIKWVNTKRILT